MRPSRLLAALSAAAILPTLMAVTAGSASAAGPTVARSTDVREIDPGKHYALSPDLQSAQRATSRAAATAAAAAVTPPVGTVRRMLALDDFNGFYYRKDYTLRAVGAKIEVWVATGTDTTATGTAFPAGDCRSAVAGTTDITDAQAQMLADQFDNNMFPKESAAFSVAPDRDGANALISGDYSGAGDKIVTLVDNVRDDNFYDFPAAPTYIAGFFSSAINELMDRNVMTIDAFDWLHRTGAAPADAPTADLCTSRPARPYLYEGVFAHEYQHLLEYYTDPAEVNFVNEGLSDFAETVTGYANSNATVFQAGSQSHLYCFNGYGTVTTPYNTNPRDCGGPQNSLTLWGDEGSGSEILADYGNAWSFMLYLYDHYGMKFMTGLHNDASAQGLAGVQAQLDAFAKGSKVYDVVHNYQLMNLLDAAVGAREGKVTGTTRAKVTSASLTASLNLDNPTSYAIPGASPNGADYVRLRDGAGKTIKPEKLRSLSFTGVASLPPQPLLWTVVAAPPAGATSSALWSGNSTNLDSTAVAQVTVPATNAVLTFNELHQAEEGYDYAYTVVSTDGGKTYTPLANANTVDGPYGPSLNGVATTFATQTFDLSAYAGQTILVGFRYVSDAGVNEGGWYVDDVSVGGTLISDGSSLTAFRSPTQISPIQVANWDVRLVGLDAVHHKALVQDYNGKRTFSLTREQLKKFEDYPMVVAVVSYDDPTEQVQQFANYTLVANGVIQPGG